MLPNRGIRVTFIQWDEVFPPERQAGDQLGGLPDWPIGRHFGAHVKMLAVDVVAIAGYSLRIDFAGRRPWCLPAPILKENAARVPNPVRWRDNGLTKVSPRGPVKAAPTAFLV